MGTPREACLSKFKVSAPADAEWVQAVACLLKLLLLVVVLRPLHRLLLGAGRNNTRLPGIATRAEEYKGSNIITDILILSDQIGVSWSQMQESY